MGLVTLLYAARHALRVSELDLAARALADPLARCPRGSSAESLRIELAMRRLFGLFRSLLARGLAWGCYHEPEMTVEIEQVTRLQSLDLKIAELEREVATLPKHIAQIEKALDSHLRRLEADRAALAANQKERKQLEDDVKVENQKISKLRDQMLGAKTNEQYRAFQNEIAFCETAIRKAEDRTLELMGESEPLDANVKKAEAALKEEKQHVEAEKAQARERTAADQKQLDELKAERAQLVAGMKKPAYSAYERIRKKWHGGSAVAEVTEGRCSGCQIQLRPQFFQDLRHAEQLMFCESCGRILYYNPPVSFEMHVATHPHP